jgi:hypothetical protein
MNWKTKRIASMVLNKMPQSMRVYDLIQKHLTKRYYRDVHRTMSSPNNYKWHLDVFKKHWGDIESAQYFEFGVARDLFSNLLNYCCGMDKQLAVDLNPLANSELVNDTCKQLRDLDYEGITRRPSKEIGSGFKKDLKEFYGIDYRAPSDARNVDLPDGSVDLIATTSTFEHIPEDVLKEILAECYRICHSGSIMSHEVDYSDHYSHKDKSITPYNFLQFSDEQWDQLYMPHYYQNTLRHNNIRDLIVEAGFKIIEESRVIPENAVEIMKRVELAPKFRDYPLEDLLAVRGYFVATK